MVFWARKSFSWHKTANKQGDLTNLSSEKSPLQECIRNNITTVNIKGDVGGDEVKSLNINVPPKKVSWADVVIGKQ